MTEEIKRTFAESALLNVIDTCNAHPKAMKVAKAIGNGLNDAVNFGAGLTFGSTFGTFSAVCAGEDALRDFEGPSDKYYVAGRTIGQIALGGALVYAIATGQFTYGLD